MTEVNNIANLRVLDVTQVPSKLAYVLGYNSPGDGGGGFFLWRDDAIFQSGDYGTENYGTIIKSTAMGSSSGSWVRQYEGYINVLFFGALGNGNDYTTVVQHAIDFAKLNTDPNAPLKGSTVFFPNGTYVISGLELKNGVALLGESIEKTIIAATSGLQTDYLFEIEDGVVITEMSNFHLVGNGTDMGCLLLEGKPIDSVGGLWFSRFSNINIVQFKGNGIHLLGGGANPDLDLPNQFNIFENIRIEKSTDFSYALLMTGQNGQTTFLNCEFDGFYTSQIVPNEEDIYTFSKGQNIRIENEDVRISAVVSFINCACQMSDYGIYIGYAENITIDNCWFEGLGIAIMVESNSTSQGISKSKSINILNNRFANASGFGSIRVDTQENIKDFGRCIAVDNSRVNVYNNYSAVSKLSSQYLADTCRFLGATNNSEGGVKIANNTFMDYKLGKTIGVMQVINVVGNTIDCHNHTEVFVNSSTNVIEIIESQLNATEILNIRANGGPITFKNTENIFFQTSGISGKFTLSSAEVATFLKVDNIVTTYDSTYQLIAVQKIFT